MRSRLLDRRAAFGRGRAPWLAGLSLAALVVIVRAVQLALAPVDVDGEIQARREPRPPNSTQRIDAPVFAENADAELARLYAMCPESAVVGLDEVVRAPEKVEALLPAVRRLAAVVPNGTVRGGERAVPTIVYPHPVRIASRPMATTRVAAADDDWLVDPKSWFNKPGETIESEAATLDSNGEAARTDAAGTSPEDSRSAPPNRTEDDSPGKPPAGSSLFTPPPVTPIEGDSKAPLFESPAGPDRAEPGARELFHGPQAGSEHPQQAAVFDEKGGVDPHLELFAKNAYPSARECAKCHEEIYDQWSVSAHAYANVSPTFHKFEQKLNDLSQGTVGYFCLRCHAPIATAMCVSREVPVWDLPEVAREGVTCLACHRVQYMYGKSNGERRIEPGPIHAPVFGGIGGDGVAAAIARKAELKLKTSPDEKGAGQDIHVTGIYFEQLTYSEFCASCHQVAVHPGIKLEVVWEQYRASPACKKGIQCQDCHMGRVPGLPQGYDCGPIAKINGKTVNEQRRKSNHIFYGPNYPIAHQGLFPFHLKANRWTMQDWLAFDWRAGWGTDEFEDKLVEGERQFPPAWIEADDRRDAREIIDDNLKKLEHKREIRVQVMENGSKVEGPFFDTQPCRGQELKFHIVMTNTNEGHNLLTASLGAQPQLWANIVLIGPDGRRLWETGYTDSYGDLANIHSIDVRFGRMPFDWQLFNLQSMFLITGAKGTDREFFVPVNLDIDQLPFIRPGTQPITTLNHPPFIRMESQSLAPLGSRRVPYRVPGELLRQAGKYRISMRMRSRAEPPYFLRFCEATVDMQRSMDEGMIDVHPMSMEFYVQ